MGLVPPVFRNETFKIFFGLLHTFAVGKTPAVSQAVNVGIYGKAGMPNHCVITTDAVLWPTAGSDSRSSKVPGTSPLYFSMSIWEAVYAFRFHGREAAGFDNIAYFVYAHLHHVVRVVGLFKERRRCFVNAFVCALRGE